MQLLAGYGIARGQPTHLVNIGEAIGDQARLSGQLAQFLRFYRQIELVACAIVDLDQDGML